MKAKKKVVELAKLTLPLLSILFALLLHVVLENSEKHPAAAYPYFSVALLIGFVAYLLVLLPVLIVYIFCQKWIMNGVVAGAVK